MSCTKKTEVRGLVFDKHQNPMPNAKLKFTAKHIDSPRGVVAVQKIITTSNQNGEYYFTFKAKRNYIYTVGCITDSTSASGISIKPGVINKYNFYFFR